jgi:hypothetical protein
MIVNLICVFLHLACQRRSDFSPAGFASQMRCIGVELPLEIDQGWATGREFLIGDCLLELGVSLVDFGVEGGGIETFSGYGKLVDKREFKISQAFDSRVASGFAESRGTTTRDKDCDSAEKHVSNNGILWRIRVHKGQGR